MVRYITRRKFLQAATVSALTGFGPAGCQIYKNSSKKPNLVFILADQWRAQATGYTGDSNAITPRIDELSNNSVNFSLAISGCPVCCPYRASLMTGRYPLSHGVFINDVYLNNDAISLAQAYNSAGYSTGFIGKWHLDGHGRSAFIPIQRRQGFAFWRGFECSHDYNNSFYYANNETKLKWEGYDAIAQTKEAQRYISEHAKNNMPFALVLSWGPPHNPYNTAPDQYTRLFNPDDISLRPNVPQIYQKNARADLAGYYSHIAALDDCVGKITRTIAENGIEKDTILVFTSDHGDMLYSQGQQKKQRPWDESIRVLLLVRYPALCGAKGKTIDTPINTPDIMPTLLRLSGIPIPNSVEGKDMSGVITGEDTSDDNAALIMCPSPFGQWQRSQGGREYRGLRTQRHTYLQDLNGPWLLYDNQKDPYQMYNLCNHTEHKRIQDELQQALLAKLEQTNDRFSPGWEYIKKWGYQVDQTGTASTDPIK